MAKQPKYVEQQMVIFKGYSEDVPDDEQILEVGSSYEIVEVNDKEGSVAVKAPNPDFNPKKKVSAANPEMIEVDVFYEEIEPSEEEGEEEEAPKAKARGKAASTDEDDEGEDQQEDTAATKKTTAKASTKTTSKASSSKKTTAKPGSKTTSKATSKKSDKEVKEEVDKYGDLDEDQEDEAVLSMIEDAEDVVELAKGLVEQNASLEYQLGGVLYHIRKEKSYVALDEEKYSAPGGFGVKSGFELFINEVIGLEYRKAMYLVDIYYKFSKYGIAAEKVAELGWTKASKIAAVMTEENAEDLVELAEETTVSELSANIKESYTTTGATTTGGEKRLKITMKFRLWEDQGEAVREALEQAAEQLGKSLDDTFEYIVMEWAAEHDVVQKPSKETTKAAGTKGSARVKVGAK